MYSKTALLLTVTAAALTNAQTADQLAELNVIVDDVKSHMSDYLGLISSGAVSVSDLPAGVMELALAVQTATDDSYTSLYKDVDVNKLGPFLTALPWYSSRLEPELGSANEVKTSAATSAATSAEVTSSTAISSEVTSAEVTSAEVTSSTAATSSISSVATSSSTAAVTEQTENNGAKAVGSFGMIAIGAAALLL